MIRKKKKISELEDKVIKIIKSEEQRGKDSKVDRAKGTEGHHQAEQHTFRRRRERRGQERILEKIMAENFPNLMKYMKINVQETQ